MATVIATRPFSVEEYHRMAEVGILKPDDPVELLDGDIIPMAPMSSRPAAAVRKIADIFQRALALAGRAIVSVQCPVHLTAHSEPEPEVALLRVKAGNYAEAHPTPGDIFLLIEVAQSSLGFDRDVKIPHYARAGVAEVWLINLEAQHVEIFREPGPLSYAAKSVSRRGQSIAPHAFSEATAAVDDLLA